MLRFLPFGACLVLLGLGVLGLPTRPWLIWPVLLSGGLVLIGLHDVLQRRHALWRNYPILAHVRWIAETLRPYLRSYIVESETEGRPFNHEIRNLIYRRAKNVSSVEPFGSHLDIQSPFYEWFSHSIAAVHPDTSDPRILIGAPQTQKPYAASVLNISAMSFGSLGAKAIESLSRGAAKGGFFHNTGEGGVSKYHRAGGGDLVWQIGSGYFGCRAPNGAFDPAQFADTAQSDQVKMIELKLSQGAKPGHGGVLPGAKVTAEIAEARGIPIGKTCYSPPAHTAFKTPLDLLDFVSQLRELSNGKPVGIKLCLGNQWEFLALCKAMLQTRQYVDFIVIDGAEGGTGAAPAEFLDHIGAPLREGLVFARNALIGTGLKQHIRLGASGKQVTAYNLAACYSLGADWVNTARGFMFALGCIQSLHCHHNTCPTGIATTDTGRQRGLVIPDKADRVYHYHKNTMRALMEVVGAAGCQHPSELGPQHLILRQNSTQSASADKTLDLLAPNALLDDPDSTALALAWRRAQAESFDPV